MRYVAVTNWERYQHYKDRHPPWIKFYHGLLDDYALTGLPIPTQLLFDRLLLLAARTENRIPKDSRWIADAIRLPTVVVSQGIPKLVQTSFLIEYSRKRSASKPLAMSEQVASPHALEREEKRTLKNKDGDQKRSEGSSSGVSENRSYRPEGEGVEGEGKQEVEINLERYWQARAAADAAANGMNRINFTEQLQRLKEDQ